MYPIINDSIAVPMPSTGEYKIPLEDCDNYNKILACVILLSEKSWISGEIISKFIETSLINHELHRPQV